MPRSFYFYFYFYFYFISSVEITEERVSHIDSAVVSTFSPQPSGKTTVITNNTENTGIGEHADFDLCDL